MTELATQELQTLLTASAATAAFKQAVEALADRAPQERITAGRRAPPIKVLRVVMKLLEARPDLALESVAIEAGSGCSNFTGELVAQPGDLRVAFNWDCAWRARQQGWTDAFGLTDQGRAARTFGYQCFEQFEVND